jgi:hypothetical protein
MTQRPSNSSNVDVLAIAWDNSWLHVYPDVPTLLQDDDIGAGNDAHGGMEFFAGDGRRLVPVFTREWRLENLVTAGDRPDPDALHDRLCAVVDHVRGYLDRHGDTARQQLARFGLTPAEAIDRLPRIEGRKYSESLTAFVPQGPEHDDEHDGDWMHNLMHRAGWTHD